MVLDRPPSIRIGERVVGGDAPTFIIAEAGVNHNGDPEMALALVDTASQAGADAVKFQAFTAETLATRSARKFAYARESMPEEDSLWAMLHRLELPRAAFHDLAAHCEERGIILLATPFDEEMVDFVAGLGVPAMKIGSSDNDNPLVLRQAAATGLPVILSTGMCSFSQVARAVETLRLGGAADIAILQCTTSYPASSDQVNLRAMPVMGQAFGAPVGLSDHTMGWHVSVAAVALGASIIEKHFTLDRDLPGPDQKASLEPKELAMLVRQVREVESAMGDGVKRVLDPESEVAPEARRFIVATRYLGDGHVVKPGDITLKRSGGGLPGSLYDLVLGMRLVRPVAEDHALDWSDFGVVRWDT